MEKIEAAPPRPLAAILDTATVPRVAIAVAVSRGEKLPKQGSNKMSQKMGGFSARGYDLARTFKVEAMNLGAVIESGLTVPQLRQMLGAARSDYKRQIEHLTLWLAVETTALRKAMAIKSATLMAEIQAQKNAAAVLQRELDITYEEIARLNAAIVAQEHRLAAHDKVAELEAKLTAARRATS